MSNLSPEQFSSVAPGKGAKWWDPSYKDAHAKAESFQSSWMNQSHHRDAYEHYVWHGDAAQPDSPHTMHTYDHVRPETKKGAAGIVTQRGPFHDFIPNENISAMAHGERKGAEPSFVREEKHMKSRAADGYQ